MNALQIVYECLVEKLPYPWFALYKKSYIEILRYGSHFVNVHFEDNVIFVADRNYECNWFECNDDGLNDFINYFNGFNVRSSKPASEFVISLFDCFYYSDYRIKFTVYDTNNIRFIINEDRHFAVMFKKLDNGLFKAEFANCVFEPNTAPVLARLIFEKISEILSCHKNYVAYAIRFNF